VATVTGTHGSGARAAVAAWLSDLAAFAYPHRCPVCGVPAPSGLVLCAPCRAAVPEARLVLCAHCLGRGHDPVACTRHDAFRVGVAWVYDERAAAVIGAFKYRGRDDLAVPLAAELARAPLPFARPDVIAEAPLHAVRRRERGYDQAALLARALADHIGVPYVGAALERTIPTRAQARLGARARRDNVAGAMRVRRPRMLAGRKVLLVDDVITTGATLEACLAVLAAAGARGGAVTLAWAQ
jgi:ComF family protein